MTTADLQPASPISAPALLRELQKNNPVFRDCLPLAIGIDKQLFAARPELSHRVLRQALAMHTRSLRYMKAMQVAKMRFNLDGSPADEVTEEQRVFAANSLHEYFKKAAVQRKEKEAAEAAKIAEEQKLEKLNQLAAKFARG
ncbi:ProQ/FINO family protein [Deefgea rivuli]|uniref:ProQ/FINO family protein n=1 Tax=Deefgea rivuli TaxID=400948 RepID=UPI00047F0A3E|nr:ProQ/FinO family protein [Deefgea rivuli]